MKKKRILKASSWLFSALIYVLILGFASNQNKLRKVTSVNIELHQPENQYFLTTANVQEMIDNQYDSLEGRTLDLINTALLEESIENHPLVYDAEVYFTLDGRVSIDVQQETAIARVIEPGRDVYMNQDGEAIPRSLNYSAIVPMITGHIDSSHWQEVHFFLRLLDDSPWLGGNIEAFERDSAGQYVVYPRFGRHHVIWGDLEHSEEKVEKLKVFYSYLEDKGTLEEIKTIDVRFDDQVVSTKY